MSHLGLNVYFWGDREQDRLLVDCLGPLAGELRSRELVERFWFDRFDARGPHVFALFSLPDHLLPEVSSSLEGHVGEYLTHHPSRSALTPEALQARHDQCRGKAQSMADRQPGLGENNSWQLFEHDSRDYPFHWTRGLAQEEELWALLDDLVRWVLFRLVESSGAAPVGAAVRWVAHLDQALRFRGASAADYWRHHATTLLPPLKERLAMEEAEILSTLPSWIGDRNRDAFASVWETGAAASWPPVDRLVEVVLAEPSRRWPLLREIVHSTLKQLGVPVALHIPLVLFAWNRNLQEDGLEISAPVGR